MSRGLGQRQLTILVVLARYEASGEGKLLGLRVEEIAHHAGHSMKESDSVRSSTRRALAKMRSRGLVGWRYYPHLQGQPRIWKITNAGWTELEHRSFDSDMTQVLVYRACGYRKDRRYDDAIAYLNRAIEATADDLMAIGERGETYRLMGRYDQAIADLTRALEIQPDYLWATQRRGLAYRAAGRYPEAITDLTCSVEIVPDSFWAIRQRGETYRLMGRYEDALDDLTHALELDPSHDDIRSECNTLRAQLRRRRE